jgi:hypothetical protein
MKVTNLKLNRLMNVVYKYLIKLLPLVHYTALTSMCLLDNEPNTLFLISIFIILFINKKSD